MVSVHRGMIRGLRRGPCESSEQNAYKHKRTTQSKSLAWPLLPQADRLRPRHSLTCSCARARGAFVTPRGKIFLKVVKIVKTRRVAPRSKISLKWLKMNLLLARPNSLNPFPSTSFGERHHGAMPIARTARTAQYGPAARRHSVQ